MVSDTGQIFDPTSSDQHYRVLLKVVTLAGYIGSHFVPVSQTNPCYLAQRRIGLLRGRRVDPSANTSLLRVATQGRGFVLFMEFATSLANELIDSRHVEPNCNKQKKRLQARGPKE